MLVGKSGSGKTNLLEALGMAAAAHDNASDHQGLLKRGIRAVKPSLMFHSANGKVQAKEIELAWCERNSAKKATLVCENHDDPEPAWNDVSWFEPAYVARVNELIGFISNGSIDDRYPFTDPAKNTVLNAAFRGSRNLRDYTIFQSLTEERILDLLNNNASPAYFAVDDIDATLPPESCRNLINAIIPTVVKNGRQVWIAASRHDVVQGLNLDDPGLKVLTLELNSDGQTVVKEITK